jgi:hypothetical protein
MSSSNHSNKRTRDETDASDGSRSEKAPRNECDESSCQEGGHAPIAAKVIHSAKQSKNAGTTILRFRLHVVLVQSWFLRFVREQG